jgi:hypothetical protein
MRLPSAIHRGVPVNGPPKLVTFNGDLPWSSATQISLDPERLDRNAIRFPSGE